MEPVGVYCCGEIIVCIESINTCDTCGSRYDQDGDRISRCIPPWEDIPDPQEIALDTIIVNE